MNFLKERIQYLWEAVLDYIYPGVCFICKKRSGNQAVLICDRCWASLQRNSGNTLASGDKRLSVTKQFLFLSWRFSYDESDRQLIHFFKFEDYMFLAELFGAEMAAEVEQIPELRKADFIVPVPLHPARKRERGYDQCMLLAKAVAQNTGITLSVFLERIKYTPPQATITKWPEKEKNVRGVFKVRHKDLICGKSVILLDDIFTTGATANECSKVLKKAGASKIMVLTTAYAV